MSSPIADSMFESISSALEAIPDPTRKSIYVLSIFVYDEDDDPRRPSMQFGYNTVERWKESIAKASNSDEAKWNFAFWLQNSVASFGSNGEESSTIRRWIEASGLWYSDEDEDEDFDRALELGDEITRMFVQACCEVASKLHSSETILRCFKQPIPVLVHQLEYYEEIAVQNEKANPPGLCAEFVSWIRNN